MAKDPTQKTKLTLKALDLALTQDITNDCYLQPKLQKCLNMHDLASEVAALSTRQEDVEEIARTGDQILRRMIWFLSSGYSITTLLGYFRPTSQGVFLESELMSAPDRKRLKLGIAYSMSQEMRQALADAEIDVEVHKMHKIPKLQPVVKACRLVQDKPVLLKVNISKWAAKANKSVSPSVVPTATPAKHSFSPHRSSIPILLRR